MAPQSKLTPSKAVAVSKPTSHATKNSKRVDSSDASASENGESDHESGTSIQGTSAGTATPSEHSEDVDMNYGTDGLGAVHEEEDNQPDSAATTPKKSTSHKKKPNSPSPPTDHDKEIVMCDCAGEGPPFVASVKKCLSSNLFKDLSLKSVEGRMVRAHKIVAIPQSDMLTKIFNKTPTKKDVTILFPMPVIKAAIRYMYNGSYAVDKEYKSEWDLEDAGAAEHTIEYHLKVLQLAAHMGIPKLEELATANLKKSLKAGNFSDELYAKLQEVPKKSNDKKAPLPEVPFGVIEAVIEGAARKVKCEVEGGIDMNKAFHNAARTIDNRYLADFIQAVGNALGKQFRLYLRCPNCACHIRAKEESSKDFACIRDDCGKQNALGQLVLDDRVTIPVVDPLAQVLESAAT